MASEHVHEWLLDCAVCGADAGEIISGLEQQLATLTTKLLPEHEAVVKEVTDMRLELEQLKVQKTLLSGSLQEKEQQLAQTEKHAAHWEEEFRVCRELLVKQEADARQEQDRADKAEQRLADALLETSSLRIENATMRGLLEMFAAADSEPLCIHDDCIDCLLCDTRIQDEALQRYLDVKAIYPHAPECPWLQARALLAQHKEQ